MSTETTKERLVRDIRQYGPDGNSVHRTEIVEVEIQWPRGKPADHPNIYREDGEWRIVS